MRKQRGLYFDWLRAARCGFPRWLTGGGGSASIVGKQKNRHSATARHLSYRLSFEPLEQRALLSVTMQFYHDLVNPTTGATLDSSSRAATSPSDITAYGSSSPGSAKTPAQIRSAYGIGSISGDGAGQTIAIIDAYRDPNIANDLAQFDSYYGLAAPPSFKILNQTGGTDVSSISVDAGWATEIALDVEWAHAIAPGASIILFEANSNSDADLWTAVDTARNYAGVSVVSMSFGGTESSSDTSCNSHFTTPSGHNGVTFLASTGDNGSPSGYPAYSPNVVAVGGTSLYLSGSSYSSETAWSGSGGGKSVKFARPSWQKGAGVSAGTTRLTPDVAAPADPNTGALVMLNQKAQQIGGTSWSAPTWAGILALINQARVAANKKPLRFLNPLLYPLNGSASFRDVTSGSNGAYHSATGHDLVTGLGSPQIRGLLRALLETA